MSLTTPPGHRTRPHLDRRLASLRVVIIVALTAGLAYYIVNSIHWPLMVDSPIMHYVTFLTDHGFTPYQTITDNNMPGAYLTERWAMAVFGGGDLGWRLYEFFLLGALTLGMIVIARPYDWLAGFLAGGLFTLLHGTEGPKYAVEREEVMATLLILGYAACFTAVRRQRPAFMLLFGFATSLAAAIKPTLAPLAVVVLALAAWAVVRQKRPALPFVLWTVAGFLITALLVLQFLFRYKALSAFVYVVRVITPSYVALWHPGFGHMLARSWPVSFLPLLPLALVALLVNRQWNWEKTALAAGFFFGFASFFIQQKGFNHHRYTYLCFFLLLAAIELLTLLGSTGWPRAVAVATLLLVVLFLVPYDIRKQRAVVPNSDFTLQLEQDLRNLGGADRLERKVMCFDLVFGCLNALYHEGIVQNSGFTGDLLFFSGSDNAASRHYKAMFWDLARQNPAEVLVISNEWFGQEPSFSKLQRWPEFLSFLSDNYTEVVTRRFPSEGEHRPAPLTDPHIEAYRIYIRRGSSLLAR